MLHDLRSLLIVYVMSYPGLSFATENCPRLFWSLNPVPGAGVCRDLATNVTLDASVGYFFFVGGVRSDLHYFPLLSYLVKPYIGSGVGWFFQWDVPRYDTGLNVHLGVKLWKFSFQIEAWRIRTKRFGRFTGVTNVPMLSLKLDSD